MRLFTFLLCAHARQQPRTTAYQARHDVTCTGKEGGGEGQEAVKERSKWTARRGGELWKLD